MAALQRQVAPQFSDLPPGATVESSPHDFSDLPPGAQVEHVPAADQPGTVAFGARQNLARNATPPQPSKGILANAWEPSILNPSNYPGMMRDMTAPRGPNDVIGMAGLGPIRSLYEPSADLLSSAAEEFGAGNPAGGIRKVGNALIPFVGPLVDKAGEQINQGDYQGAIGTAGTAAVNLFGPKVLHDTGIVPKAQAAVQSAGQGIASKLYRSALKPTGPRAALQAERGLAEGIPVGTAASKPRRAAVLKEQGQLISGPLNDAPQDPIIKHGPILEDLDALKGKLRTEEHAPVDSVVEEFLKDAPNPEGLTPSEAFALKVKYQNSISRSKLTAWSPEAVNPIRVEAWQQIVNNLRGQIVENFPQVAEPMARYGPVKEMGRTLQTREVQSANRWPAAGMSMATGVGGAFMSHNPLVGIPVAAATEAFLDPTLRSRLAIGLYRASGGTAVPKGMVRPSTPIGPLPPLSEPPETPPPVAPSGGGGSGIVSKAAAPVVQEAAPVESAPAGIVQSAKPKRVRGIVGKAPEQVAPRESPSSSASPPYLNPGGTKEFVPAIRLKDGTIISGEAEGRNFTAAHREIARGLSAEELQTSEDGYVTRDGIWHTLQQKADVDMRRVQERLAEKPSPSAPVAAAPVGAGGELRPETHTPEANPPIAALGSRWQGDRGSMPGEPSFYLDGFGDDARAAITEVEQRDGGAVWEATLPDGQSLGQFSTIEQAAKAAEIRISPAPVEAPAAEAVGAVQEGMVRLYRGQPKGGFPPATDAADRGRWFTTDPDLAGFFGPNRNMLSVDVPESVAAAAEVPDALYSKSGRLLPAEWANRAAPFAGGATEPPAPPPAPAPTGIRGKGIVAPKAGATSEIPVGKLQWSKQKRGISGTEVRGSIEVANGDYIIRGHNTAEQFKTNASPGAKDPVWTVYRRGRDASGQRAENLVRSRMTRADAIELAKQEAARGEMPEE